MRRVLLVVTLLFIAALAAMTAFDISQNGPTPLDVVAILIIGLFGVGIVGALREHHD
jgi:hypothetical protein